MPSQNGNQRLQLFKRLWPHFLIVNASVAYLLLGGYLFYLIETRWALHQHPSNETGHQNISRKSQLHSAWQCNTEDTIEKIHLVSHACNASALTLIPESQELNDECKYTLLVLFECLNVQTSQGQNTDRYLDALISGRSKSTQTQEEWTWTTGVILAFTIVTTIGYGKITPQTSAGRLFCIIYGMFGIPLVLLALANQGRYFSSWLLFLYKTAKKFIRWIQQMHKFGRPHKSHHNSSTNQAKSNGFSSGTGGGVNAEDAQSLASSEEAPEQTIPASVLLCIITGYLAFGGYLIKQWESWSFVDSTYFVFTSASSIGFGDLVPSNKGRMALTFLYICLGLALTTTAIDIFAEYLRRLHYWGAKIKNAASTFVWFGGNKVTINQLVRTIGHELGASEDKIKTIVKHLDSVINMALQEAAEQQEIVEAAELQYVDNFLPAANERLLVHRNSCEFGIAEASLLSPLIFSPADQQQNIVVVNNNDTRKRRSIMQSLESLKSLGAPDDRRVARLSRVVSTGECEQIQFIDNGGSTLNIAQSREHHQPITIHTATENTTVSADSSPRELLTFASD